MGAGTDSVTIYLNGVALDVDLGTAGVQAKRAIANIPALGGTQRLFARYTGSADNTQLTGLIDDYRIYDTALSASEIAVLATPPPDPAVPSTTGLYPQEPASVSPLTNLVASFSKNIALKAGGSITLTDTTDGSIIKSFANLPLEHDTGERGTVVYPYTAAAWGVGQGPDDWIPNGRAWT